MISRYEAQLRVETGNKFFLTSVNKTEYININPKNLDMNSNVFDVLGLIFGSYLTGKRQLNLSDEFLIENGLYLPWEDHDSYAMLTHMWKEINNFLKYKVNKGYEFLKYYYPVQLSKIIIETIELRNPQQCILGQMFGSYRKGLIRIIKDGFCKTNNYGIFAINHGLDSERFKQQGQTLNQLWKEKLYESATKGQ